MTQAINAKRKIGAWLLVCCLMVALMVVIGGLTRLTGSGLSMTRWEPIHGIFPPLTQESWEAEFADYQQSPEYTKVNFGMNVEEFKGIFWLEYIHRVAGRLTGFVFLLPFLYFAARGYLSKPLSLKLGGIFILGGLQGLMGWYMVQSGLVDEPWVSPYRLTVHLALAFLIFALLLWTGLQQLLPSPAVIPVQARISIKPPPKMMGGDSRLRGNDTLYTMSKIVMGLLTLQILLGGMVAGLDAGLIYNSFPTMNGQWLPDGLFGDAITFTQFIHRWLAMIVTGVMLTLWWQCRTLWVEDDWLKWALDMLVITVILQVALGIITLLRAVPVHLGALHQGTALLLWGCMVCIVFRLRQSCAIRQQNDAGILPVPKEGMGMEELRDD